MKSQEQAIFDLFKVVRLDRNQGVGEIYTSLIKQNGVVTNFKPTGKQVALLQSLTVPLDIKTLFKRTDLDTKSTMERVIHQLMNYIETYGFGISGPYNQLEVEGTIVTLHTVRGLSTSEIHDMIRNIMYSNAPIKNTVEFADIVMNEVRLQSFVYDFSKIKNNELKVVLFDEARDTFDNGDDAVRWLVKNATGVPLLIKSPEVIAACKQRVVTASFFERHALPLATVFNRHKRIILAFKRKQTASVINNITRLSKKHHVPILPHISKRFVVEALEGRADGTALKAVSVRDKFKFLNTLAWKKQQSSFDAFVVRNGKIHLSDNRKVYTLDQIDAVEQMVLTSLKEDLKTLSDKVVVLDKNVDYGLPVSRKQTLGNLPFGTVVTMETDTISSGVYWKNSWGATDLDLSTVDQNGRRTGWGSWHSYENKNDIKFSGDVTYAPSGGMEFMTSSTSDYGLFVNIFNGSTPSTMELVVGSGAKGKWINDVFIREKHELKSRGEIIGFVRGKQFIVYTGRLNDRIANFGNNPIVKKATVNAWTIKTLFDAVGVKYCYETENVADHDLSYSSFSFDKLEKLFSGE